MKPLPVQKLQQAVQEIIPPKGPRAGQVMLDRRLTSVRAFMTAGLVTTLVLVGGIGVWAATTELAGAVIAPGTVVVASSIKKIQHPTGGVVGKINVKNGDEVHAGDILVSLDDTVMRANLQLITKQIDELTGRIARLEAERDGQGQIDFPAGFLARGAEPDVGKILKGEQSLFETRRQVRSEQKMQLGERISGLREEISGNTAQATAKSQEIKLIADELSSLATLEQKQLVTTSKMMALRREAARLEGEKAQLQAAAGANKGRVAEIEVQKLNVDSEAKSDVIKDLREAQGKLVELVERRTAASDQLQRVDIKSPVDGIVHQMSVFTVGGVVNTSEPLMMIVPKGDDLVIDIKIAPQDIDQARSHDEANIRFPAFNQRTTPTIAGKVVTISADLSKDQQPQGTLTYYAGRVQISEDDLPKLKGLKLIPGMPAEVQIKTSARTALSYLFKPIEDQFAKAFKER